MPATHTWQTPESMGSGTRSPRSRVASFSLGAAHAYGPLGLRRGTCGLPGRACGLADRASLTLGGMPRRRSAGPGGLRLAGARASVCSPAASWRHRRRRRDVVRQRIGVGKIPCPLQRRGIPGGIPSRWGLLAAAPELRASITAHPPTGEGIEFGVGVHTGTPCAVGVGGLLDGLDGGFDGLLGFGRHETLQGVTGLWDRSLLPRIIRFVRDGYSVHPR